MICLIRAVCLYELIFLEETIGEKYVRKLTILLSIGIGVFTTCFQFKYGENLVGTTYSLITRRQVEDGIFLMGITKC